MNTRKKVIFIGPHPDDIFISCAGFILENIDKFQFEIYCFATNNLLPSVQIRLQEEQDVWKKILGKEFKVNFFKKGIDTDLKSSYNDIVKYIELAIKDNNIKYIFTPFNIDTHQDHVAISNATLSACRYSKNILFYETPSTYNFDAKIFVNLKQKSLQKKKSISKTYNSQILGNNEYSLTLSDFIEAKALSNGAKSRICKYAEGFTPFKFFLE